MATNSLQSLHYHHHLHNRRHFSTTTTIDHPPSTISLKPTTTNYTNYTNHTSYSSTTTFSISPITSTTQPSTTTEPPPPPPPSSTSFDLLTRHLSTQNFRQADEETRRLIIALAGEPAIKRGYVFFSEVQFISTTSLKTIDNLWKQYSNNKFGYSIQKKIFFTKTNQDFTKFFIKVGWMKLLDTEVVQYNYRAFPNEFIWELNDDTPEGHLPLTNALRGTQLLNCILRHPAFDDVEEEEQGGGLVEESSGNSSLKGTGFSKALSNNRQYKSDYSF